ncbi:MAG: DNA polymerase III subunit alpha [Chitinophagales bacterium]|nr:DNA polymerase III subunit alpha [Chitinophagales bacterium]
MILNLHSYHSLRYGTLSIAQLVDNLVAYGYDTGVLTDINNSSAALEFVRACKEVGINGLVGVEFRNGDQLLYIGIAKNIKGFKELNDYLTQSNRYNKSFDFPAPEFENVFTIYPYHSSIDISQLRDSERIGVRMTELNKVSWQSKREQKHYVILHTVSYQPQDYLLHSQLRAIDHNLLISRLEYSQKGSPSDIFIHQRELLHAFKELSLLIENTEQLLMSCSLDFIFNVSKNKKFFTGNAYDDKLLLHKYSMDGWKRRYGQHHQIAKERIEKELEIIDQLQFSSYFLITDDICRYARNRNFHYVGRGSGANSIVAYCLGITEVCPISLNLYFERFLNPKRQSPPDFDVDFSWKDRDEMYDYIFKRYQRQHTALMGAVSTFKDRSVIRELGKIYGLPKTEIDRLIFEPTHQLNNHHVAKIVLESFYKMIDFPNQRTIHSSGVLISEEPLTYYSALDYPPKGLPTVQYDMYVAENIGFEKFDILSQRGIGHIKECRELIRLNRGETIDIPSPQHLFADTQIAEQLQRGDTIGCFYIESPAMRQLLRKLRCDNYLTLVAASSIIRPGVSSSGMMQTYIDRHLHPERVKYLHPVFQEQLAETYGVMVYQEDVMKIGSYFGGLDLADADVLRRMMSGKYRNKKHLEEIENKYFTHCKHQGYSDDIAKEVWRQMESFAGYSFNKAHSASFAVESYQSLYLKTYFPLEFIVAVLNNYGGFYSREVYIQEVRKAGGEVCLPCVNHSCFATTIDGNKVYLGFDGILNIEERLAHLIEEERLNNGCFSSIENFYWRTGADLEQVLILIHCGAFRFLETDKKELLWTAHIVVNQQVKAYPDKWCLFESPSTMVQIPKFYTQILEHLYDEIQYLGFPVSGSLFDLAKSTYRGNVKVEKLKAYQGQTVRIVAQLLTWKTIRTSKGSLMKFGTFCDADGHYFETVHFSKSIQSYPLKGKGLYLIEGKCVVEYDFPSIEVYRCAKMPLQSDPRA